MRPPRMSATKGGDQLSRGRVLIWCAAPPWCVAPTFVGQPRVSPHSGGGSALTSSREDAPPKCILEGGRILSHKSAGGGYFPGAILPQGPPCSCLRGHYSNVPFPDLRWQIQLCLAGFPTRDIEELHGGTTLRRWSGMGILNGLRCMRKTSRNFVAFPIFSQGILVLPTDITVTFVESSEYF